MHLSQMVALTSQMERPRVSTALSWTQVKLGHLLAGQLPSSGRAESTNSLHYNLLAIHSQG